jgi:hypothetical protein
MQCQKVQNRYDVPVCHGNAQALTSFRNHPDRQPVHGHCYCEPAVKIPPDSNAMSKNKAMLIPSANVQGSRRVRLLTALGRIAASRIICDECAEGGLEVPYR